jgi:sugar phosphate isomerase/epimerase
MMKYFRASIFAIISIVFPSAFAAQSSSNFNEPSPDLFLQDNLLAWCIVPFDSEKRGPEERIAMLKRLGFSQYVWDWRDEHLADLKEEIRLAQANDIRMRAVWIWVDRNQVSVGNLGAANRFIFDTFEDAKLPTEYWVGFNENFFDGLDDEECVRQAAEMVGYLRDEAARSGSTVALYNHGGWFGEPDNEIKIIKAVGDPSVGMVFNFHHAHPMIDEFPDLLPRMLPYLRAININGMDPEGPKIILVGQGTHEAEMIRLVLNSGYDGPIGVLGHVDDADVEKILEENLAGLKAMKF